MKIKSFAVLDTNVVVSAMKSKEAYPYKIYELINSKNVIPVFDRRMLNEYYKVMHYPKFKYREDNIYDSLRTIVSNGLFVNSVEELKCDLGMPDKSDIPFFEVKESTGDLDTYLVTGNLKHYPEAEDVVTPKEFVLILNRLDKTLELMEASSVFCEKYEDSVTRLVYSKTLKGKYTLGENIVPVAFDVGKREIKKSYFDPYEQLNCKPECTFDDTQGGGRGR